MQNLDTGLFRWINNWPEAFAPLMKALSDGYHWTPVRIGLLIFLIVLLWNKRTRMAGICAPVAVGVANACTDVIKATWPTLRPTVALPDVLHRVEGGMGLGTASAHSANMMAVAVVMGMLGHWGLFAVWIVIAILTGLSRIYNGVHFPYQVLFGWAVGAFMGWLVTIVAQSIKARVDLRKEEREPEMVP